MMNHALTIYDRGLEHIHRFRPECTCGWIGVNRRRKREAEQQYKQHTRARESARRMAHSFGPASVTPNADLPIELRRAC